MPQGRGTAPPAGPFPYATLALIAATTAVFLLQLAHPGGVHGSTEQWGEVPRRIAGGESVPGTAIPAWITMLTYMLLHSSWWHLKGNMFVLALAGASLERRAGALRLLLVYFGSGVLASLVCTSAQWYRDSSMVGASGAVLGVVVAWLLIAPWAWRGGWLTPRAGWRGAAAWVETALRIAAVWRAAGSWLFWPLIVAAFSGNWHVLAFRTNLTHMAGALFGALLLLPYTVLLWSQHLRTRTATAQQHCAADPPGDQAAPPAGLSAAAVCDNPPHGS